MGLLHNVTVRLRLLRTDALQGASGREGYDRHCCAGLQELAHALAAKDLVDEAIACFRARSGLNLATPLPMLVYRLFSNLF
jgi:hypothetical protein